ncbi:hypothetical protein DFH08DRAFT_798304 [Mycena albidolilacea]|uniref:Uncharacterized protein n=1 Tax=Mycena albidolilacea TaxID=1033008 RepID=A0AAD7AN56_9AGAR|nr:hypothetical protein DFH08DRAFT_798304 [Mycena albidolilacea]
MHEVGEGRVPVHLPMFLSQVAVRTSWHGRSGVWRESSSQKEHVWHGRRMASSRAVATGACVRASSDKSVSEVCKARTIAHGNTLVVAPPSASPKLPSNWVCLQAFIDARVHKTSHHQDATIAVWSMILKLAHRWQFTKSRPSSRANLRARVPVQRREENAPPRRNEW